MMGGFPLIIPTEPVMIVMAVVIMLVIQIMIVRGDDHNYDVW